MACDAKFPLVPYGGVNDRGYRGAAHVTQGSGEKVIGKGCDGAGAVRRKSLPDRGVVEITRRTFALQINSCNATTYAAQKVNAGAGGGKSRNLIHKPFVR